MIKMNNQFEETLLKKLEDSYDGNHKYEQFLLERNGALSDDSKISNTLRKQWKKECEFLVDTVPSLMPFFIERWTTGKGFGPIELVKHNSEIGLNEENFISEMYDENHKKREVRNITKYFLFRPTALGIIDKIGKKELGYLPLLEDMGATFKHPKMNYIDIIAKTSLEIYGNEMMEAIKNNYSFKNNNFKENGKEMFLTRLEREIQDKRSDCWFSTLNGNAELRDLEFQNSPFLFKEKEGNLKLIRIKGNYTRSEWMEKYDIRMISPNINFETQMRYIEEKLDFLKENEIKEQIISSIKPYKKIAEKYNVQQLEIMKSQVKDIREDIFNTQLSDLEKELEQHSIVKNLPMNRLYGKNIKTVC